VTQVHHTALVGDGVELGERVVIGPQVVLVGAARIADDCWIGPGCVIGTPPEIIGIEHNRHWQAPLPLHGVRIGPRTVVRELSTIHQGSRRPTRIGADCWLLNRVYLAHDCQVGNRVTLSAGTSLGGHVLVGDEANVGMNAVVHQHRMIGPGAMVGMGSVVTRDVPPYAMAFGNPARLHGVNEVGMRRAGVPDEDILLLDADYRDGRMPPVPPAALVSAFEWWAAGAPERPMVAAAAPTGPAASSRLRRHLP
jgi:UDP-N-acetylglucosamine acyltransferase